MEPLDYEERVCGAASDLYFTHCTLLLHSGAPSCLVWLGQVRGWGQGAVGHGHNLQLGLIWHKQDGLALHTALLPDSIGSLSSAGNTHPAGPWVVEGEGGQLAWPRALVGLKDSPLLWPGLLSHHLSLRVSTASGSGRPPR